MKVHVPANFVGYGMFALAAMVALGYLIKQQATQTKWHKLAPLWLLGLVMCLVPLVFRKSSYEAGGMYWVGYLTVSGLIAAFLVLARKPIAVFPFYARMLWWTHRFSPRLMIGLLRLMMWDQRRRFGATVAGR
jgi:FtsH-binding integral membrane protein